MRTTTRGKIQRFLCRDSGRRFGSAKQNPIIELEVEEDIVSQSIKDFDAGSNFAQVPVSRSDFVSKEALHDPPFPVGENVSSHVSSCETTAEKRINAFASTVVNTRVCATAI